ncbi:MAG: Helix-turn-helix domain [Actinomycetota bacterium]|jgi:excisionase family DNA binding protein
MTLDDLKGFPSAVLTVSEVSRLLRVDRRTVSKAVKESRLPVFSLGGKRILIPKEPLLALLTNQKSIEDVDGPF